MVAVTTRAGKGSPLTNAEIDANWNALVADLNTKMTQAQARAAISVSGSLTYNSTTGVLGFTETPLTSANIVAALGFTPLSNAGGTLSGGLTVNGTLTQQGNQVLHASNYNSYSPSLTGSGASGTWGINITGNAASVSGINASQFFNNMGNNHTTYTDANSIPGFGFYYLQGTANGPGNGNTQWYGMALGLGNDYAYGSYAMQFAIPRTPLAGNPYPAVRFRENGSWGSWSKIWAGYADTAGSATDSTKLPLSGGELSGSLRINTSGSGSTTSHLIIKRSGQTPASFGGYSGSWRSSLEIWNNDSTKMLFLNSAENDSGYANIKSVGGGFFIDVGSNGATRAIQIEASGAANFPQSLTQGGNQVLHAGNYTSYALPLSGGTLTGRLTVPNQTVQSTSPTIDFYDTDQGTTRYLHVNGNLMGFLNTGGGWDMYANNSGQVWTANYGWLHDYFFSAVSNCFRGGGNPSSGWQGAPNCTVNLADYYNCGDQPPTPYYYMLRLVDNGSTISFGSQSTRYNCNCDCNCC